MDELEPINIDEVNRFRAFIVENGKRRDIITALIDKYEKKELLTTEETATLLDAALHNRSLVEMIMLRRSGYLISI